jgi:hypothetical protein
MLSDPIGFLDDEAVRRIRALGRGRRDRGG